MDREKTLQDYMQEELMTRVRVIKSAFENNQVGLQSLRAVLLNLEPTLAEKRLVTSLFANEELLKVFSRMLVNNSDKYSHILDFSDPWLPMTRAIIDKPQESIKQAIDSQELSLKYARQGLGLLTNPDGEAPDLAIDLEDVTGIKLIARNTYIQNVKQQLENLYLIAQQESAEDKEKNAREEAE